MNDLQKAQLVLPPGMRNLTLPEICIKVHMHTNGSSDEISAEHYLCAVEYIENRLSIWSHNNCTFDNSVRMMCRATIKEAKESGDYSLNLLESIDFGVAD